jgi:hypothetical protein
MKAVAYIELFIFIRVVLGALTLQTSLIAPIIYAHFLRQRYFQSAFTREALSATTARVDGLIKKPSNPPVLVNVWEKAQMLVQRWAGVVLQPAAAAAAERR